MSWTAPSDGGSPITSYTVTPYVGSTAQTPTTVSRLAARDRRTTITGLTNGTTYTFTVTATNAVGTGPALRAVQRGHADSAQPSPAFVQATSAHAAGVIEPVRHADVERHCG